MEEMVNLANLFQNVYKDKRVLVTGHTGFKGSWLSLWLIQLGADVIGYSKYIPSDPSNFNVLKLSSKIKDIEGDVRDLKNLQTVFEEHQPEIVFHLAAQPIVRESYNEPKLTFDTNLGGSVNIFECIKNTSSVKSAIIITSDKCYENVEQVEGYHEEDRLGGADPYSASKACAEIAFSSYFRSFFAHQDSLRICTTRAGNVIGGGDWAKDRIVPDCVRAWSVDDEVVIRNPDATRPWQHVLEPLSGYLWLGACLYNEMENISGEAFNFGPKSDVIKSVGELADLFIKDWGKGSWKHVPSQEKKKEATLLTLSCQKALEKIVWEPVLNFDETIRFTADWYKEYYSGKGDIFPFAVQQIRQYVAKAQHQSAQWATINPVESHI